MGVRDRRRGNPGRPIGGRSRTAHRGAFPGGPSGTALEPPVARTVLVGGLLETAIVAGHTFELGTLARTGRGRSPDGGRLLEAFELEGMRPTWRYVVGGAVLERHVWMAHGANATYVRYRVLRGGPVALRVEPLVTHRDRHDLVPMDDRRPDVRMVAGGLVAHWDGHPTVLSLLGPGAAATPQPGGTDRGWIRGIALAVETERGLDDVGDLAVAGAFDVTLSDGAAWTLVLSAEDAATVERDGERALAATRARDESLLARAGVDDTSDPVVRQLVLAADQFIVTRPIRGETTAGRSIIAGYPWFNDWGRETMIALPSHAQAWSVAEALRALRSIDRE